MGYESTESDLSTAELLNLPRPCLLLKPSSKPYRNLVLAYLPAIPPAPPVLSAFGARPGNVNGEGILNP